jgi:hypothetical protein
MGDVISAVNQGSIGALALALAGVLLTALIAILVWLTRERIDARRRYDATLEKRLQAGAGKMERIENSVQALQIKAVELSAGGVSRGDCKECGLELRSHVERVAQASRETQEAIGRLDARLEEGLRQVSRLLSGIVKIEGRTE